MDGDISWPRKAVPGRLGMIRTSIERAMMPFWHIIVTTSQLNGFSWAQFGRRSFQTSETDMH
jgi:hypothetical protein